jgi:hypothetical protein
VDTNESSVFRPREASEDHHPHACTDGLVFLTYPVFDEAVGEEVERLEVVPWCRAAAAQLADSPSLIALAATAGPEDSGPTRGAIHPAGASLCL